MPAYGTVTAQPEGWHGDNTITRDDGRTVIIGRKWLIKVPEGKQAVGRRRQRLRQRILPRILTGTLT